MKLLRMIFKIDILPRTAQRLFCQRRCTLTRALVIVILTVLVVFGILNYRNGHVIRNVDRVTRHPPPTPYTTCNSLHNRPLSNKGPHNHNVQGDLKIGRKVLIVVETPFSRNAKNIAIGMESARFVYKIVEGNKIPTLTHMGKGRFGIVIFETINLYMTLDDWSRQLIDKYCYEFKVGMIFFMKPQNDNGVSMEKFPDFSLTVHYNVGIKEYKLNPDSRVWRITKPGEIVSETFPEGEWAVFHFNHSTFEPLASAIQIASFYDDYEPSAANSNKTVYPAILDKGENDGIRRVFFGQDFSFWLHSLMLLDSISYLSYGMISLSLERYIQIDIDDIFVAAIGTRMKADDVVALVESQSRLQESVEGFHFMLGFSGWYYQHGNEEENLGDRTLLEYKDHFHWFPHMWRHEQPHKFSQDELLNNMNLNYQFAKENGISVMDQYAVAPHHSGVFPVHDPVYTAWKTVWDIKVTSTEEYPRLHPAWGRKGFVHRGIMVLPRQTCGLFTHTYLLDSYPGGPGRLEKSIHGGELFKTFLYNPLNIYMTHLSNYGNDRLALYTFESVIKFVQCWTNLKLKQGTPMDHAIKYFDMFPEEQMPQWRNPCDSEKHMEIWSANKTCDRFPKFLVVGPQKTGTTALYTFLSMHPWIRSNFPSKESFEEVQFFNGNNYFNGIDWYLEYFPHPQDKHEYLFEKSAAYFDNILVPKRVHNLLPNSKIICILISPAKRAYSWYQHMRAHNDPVAVNYTFNEVVSASDSAPREVKALRNRCLLPGEYAHHLERWLDHFSYRQIHIIDGEQLKDNPIGVMDEVQKFLGIEKYLNYTSIVRYDSKKGFYCQVLSDNKNKCLGRSKGRQYNPMDEESEDFLKKYYHKHNTALVQLLGKLKIREPAWLKDYTNTAR
ncbi:bifunctional heparan sulfate N-deacetylase/N-sulfotransferase-like [Mya arenaria]|uniref:bifunctional heparan sulfate N-deacetylase/N-sulfotransferase-like n=1 Tax=Mya arenaria TaxID=6604 RepID=UPI0022E5F6F1|nr:bifunctional heparan sulfate N-deacetylase/N-sulfotransferase-like [Mya arenaria]